MPSDMPKAEPARRPIASRDAGWAKAFAARLAASSVTPNQISGVSVLFAAAGCALIGLVQNPAGWLGAALCVQLRLVCNLLDGMVAIEGGKKSSVGALWNEFPDRVADTLLLVPVGYAAGLGWAGWAAALLAALTAYVRVFGGSLGLAQDFSGIMAKQRRMALLTAALVAQAIEWTFSQTRWSLLVAILLIAAGSAVTCVTRTLAVVRELEGR
ncbi:CDP-alcohol phosphatidyltransferase family protein [Chelatococcus sambhunathii]